MKINGYILFIVACILLATLCVPLFLGSILFIKSHNSYFFKLAYSIDQFGNVLGGPLFDKVLIKKPHYRFGNPDETISYVIAENKAVDNLTYTGTILDNILNFIDPGHTDLPLQRAMRIVNKSKMLP